MIQSAEEFVQLRISENPDEYLRAAWEEAPTEVWYEVINRFPPMRFWVAQNKTIPVCILERLAEDDDERVRIMVAAKGKLPEELQVVLAQDTSSLVRTTVAGRKKVATRALDILLADPDSDVREIVQQRLRGD